MEPTTTDQAAETAAAAPEKAKTEEKAAPAAETKAPAQASDAKRPAKAPQGKKGNRHGDHRGNGDRHNSRGHDHPAPMGALQQALKKNGNRHLGTRYPIVSSAKHHRRRNFICHPIEIR